MQSVPPAPVQPASRQRGVAAVEFALVALLFFLLLFGAIEFGRLLYLWNTVQEVTRNAARQLVVTDFRNLVVSPSTVGEVDMILRRAVFGSSGGGATQYLPASPEISNAKIIVRYLNPSGDPLSSRPSSPSDNIVACAPGSSRLNECIAFVEVCLGTIEGDDQTKKCAHAERITFVPLVGLFSGLGSVGIPLSTVRMPAESLGFRPVP